MIPDRSLPDGKEPVLYFGFDTLSNVQLKEGPADAHISAFIDGKVRTFEFSVKHKVDNVGIFALLKMTFIEETITLL